MILVVETTIKTSAQDAFQRDKTTSVKLPAEKNWREIKQGTISSFVNFKYTKFLEIKAFCLNTFNLDSLLERTAFFHLKSDLNF